MAPRTSSTDSPSASAERPTPGTAHRRPAPQSVLARLAELADRHRDLQDELARLREERDHLILVGLDEGLSSSALAANAALTGARVRAIADAAASSSARDRVASAVAKIAAHTPAICTTYGALAAAVDIGSAKGVASSLATNPDVSSQEGARVLLLKWASPLAGGYVIPDEEPAWQTQGHDTATRLECLQADGVATRVRTGAGEQWIVPFDRVCADPRTLAEIVAG